MAKSLEFGKSVLIMDVDDSRLEAGLKADEQLVKQSVNKMQGNMNKLEVSMRGTAQAGVVASRGVAVLGTAAALTGSAVLATSGYAVTMAIGLKELGNEALGASAQLVTLGRRSLALIATPIGAIITATALALGALAIAARKAAGGIQELTEQEKLLADIMESRHKQTRSFEKSLETLQDKMGVTTGRMSAFLARWRELGRTRPELSLAQTLRLTEAEQALQRIQDSKAAADRKERAALDEITRKQKEALALAEGRARAQEQAAAAAEAEARALAARAGPQTPAEARTMIGEQIALENARQRGINVLLHALERSRPGGQRHGIVEEMLQRLGYGAGRAAALGAPTATRFGPGAIELSAFAGTGRGGGVAAAPDPVQSARIAKENERTADLKAVRRSSERTAVAVERLRMGAN